MSDYEKHVEEVIKKICIKLIYGEPEKQVPAPRLIPRGVSSMVECGNYIFETKAGGLSHGYFIYCYERRSRALVMTSTVKLQPPTYDENRKAKLNVTMTVKWFGSDEGKDIVKAFKLMGLTWVDNPIERLHQAFLPILDSERYEEMFTNRDKITHAFFKYGDNFTVRVTFKEDTEKPIVFKFHDQEDRLVGFFSLTWTGDRLQVQDHPYLCSIDTMVGFLNDFDKHPQI